MDNNVEVSDIIQLSEEEKNQIVKKHFGIVYWLANRYKIRFNVEDIEEIQGWGFLGLAKAINQYEKNQKVSFSSIAFTCARREIMKNFIYKNSNYISDVSLEKKLFNENEEDSKSLNDLMINDNLVYSKLDIIEIITTALSEEPTNFMDINVDYLINQLEIDEISVKYNLPIQKIQRILKRGKTLIKLYLSNNDIISDELLGDYNSIENKNSRSLKKNTKLSKNEIGKIRYIGKHFPFFDYSDIAAILNLNQYEVYVLRSYPTASYYKTPLDDSIYEKAYEYATKKYPERIPGEVMTVQL